MIEGLRFDVAPEELKQHLEKRIKHHQERVQFYNNQATALEQGNAEGMQYTGGDPVRALKDGGREDRIYHFMTNGIFLNGIKKAVVINNYVFRTGQNAIQCYGLSDSLVQDNDFESTGGGGNPSVWMIRSNRNTFRRNNYRDRSGLGINTQAGFVEVCCDGNVYEDNLVNGEAVPVVLRKPCD